MLVNDKVTSSNELNGDDITEGISSKKASLFSLRKERVKLILELNYRYSNAFICVIFILIGGSTGALIQKGGYGYSLLGAIFFFLFYFVMTIVSERMAKAFVIKVYLAAWLPFFILLVISILMIYRIKK